MTIRISEPTPVTAANAWGQYSTEYYHQESVTEADVGKGKPHYLGFNHRTYEFNRDDVGRTITVRGDGCWSFDPRA